MMDKKIRSETLPYDHDLDIKVKKCMERISENIHISANEPSLAVYRLQEHVRRALPPTIGRRQNVLQLHTQLQGACYDVEYALGAVHSMSDSAAKLTSIQEMLKDTIFYRKQLKYEQSRRKREPSMYKRLSSHLTSMDLPDFHDFPDALRETASRVESALQHARSSYEGHSKKEKSKSCVAEENEEEVDESKQERQEPGPLENNACEGSNDKTTNLKNTGKSSIGNETKSSEKNSSSDSSSLDLT